MFACSYSISEKKADVVIELVAEEQDGAVEVDFVLVAATRRLVVQIIVMQLAITANDGAAGLAVIEGTALRAEGGGIKRV